MTNEVRSIKGFNADWSCRGYKFELGATYEHPGRIAACGNGFHACDGEQHPLSVFEFYPPAGARYADVIQGGDIDRQGTKIASAKITIEAEITLPDLIQRAVDWVFARAKWSEGPFVTGDNEAATASGYQGAATASGYYGKVRGTEGNALFLVYRETWDGPISHVWAGIAGRDGVKSNVWYRLDGDGNPVEVEA